jgi:transposase InsO family protein
MHGRAPSEAPIAGHIVADKPGEAWVMDVLHMLPSADGHVAVLIAVDVFSRYCVLMPMYSIDSEEAAELAKLHVIGGPGGVPNWILTDNGPEFKGEFIHMCNHYGIQVKKSAPGHSQSHGMVERLVATTELTLAHYIDDDMTIWRKMVSHAQLIHNSTAHPALTVSLRSGYTPGEVFLGRKLHDTIDHSMQSDFVLEKYSLAGYIQHLKDTKPGLIRFVKQSQARYLERMDKTARNRSRKLRIVRVGSLVKLYKRPAAKKHAKLWRAWQGPCRVVKVSDDGANADIKHVASDEVIVNQHVNDISLYVDKPNSAVPEEERRQPEYAGKSYVVEEVIDDKGTHGVDKHYRIRWKGYADTTWEPEDNLNCPKLVQEYTRRKARKPPALVTAASDGSTTSWSTTLTFNLLDVDPSDMTAEICRKAGISVGNVAGKLGFVPCETYSIADLSNVTRGFHYRDHDSATKHPRLDLGLERDKALAHDLLVSNILTAWACDRDAGYRHAMLLENPVGSLQHRPFMKWMPKLLGMAKHVVHYCAYDHIFKKPTNIWTNLRWEPKGLTGDGRCNQDCGHGAVQDNGKYKHFYGLAQEPCRGPRGQGANKLKNSVPDLLLQEWMATLVRRRECYPDQNTVIDLCAGYQSLKPWAMANGFNYIAVDIMGDRNLKRRTTGG